MSREGSRGDAACAARIGSVVLGCYELRSLIGQGGMGAVYEARHLRLGRRVAVKVVRPGLADDAKVLARFEQEALSAGALESEHIPAVIDFARDESAAPCLVMEYLEGKNLAQLLEAEGPLPIARAVDIIRQACRGLGVAHAAGIVHRDLKPSNLLLCRRSDGSDLVKIVDFGIAKVMKPHESPADTTTGATLGTPHYMSPEQARGEKSIDQRTDIYALGAILYELLTSTKPHPGDTYNAIIYHILSKEPAPLREVRPLVPEGLARVVHRALSREADDRPSSIDELAASLGPYAPDGGDRLGSSDTTLQSSGSVSASSPASASRTRLAVAFVAGVLLTGGVVALLRSPRPREAEARARTESPQPETTSPASVPAAHEAPSARDAPVPPPPDASRSARGAAGGPVASPPRAAPRAGSSPAAAHTVAAPAPQPSSRFELRNPYQ
ncbi:MAG: serine/threonine protein kinase [Polyangiaceae bacterium]|nr:serine/threonine protein kinase [Polyangiaceae bacterium]